MSLNDINNDRAMSRAEAAYLEPPDESECECEPTSDCCGATLVADTDVCGECREHCGSETLCHCEADEDDRREDAALARAEEKEEMYR